MCSILENISVIVPVAPWDKDWKNLLKDLELLPEGAEIIFVMSDLPYTQLTTGEKRNIRFIKSESGRAKALNAGAKAATKDYLWFVHADSKFYGNTISSLEKSLELFPDRIHYFNLKFLNDGPALIFLNEIGVRLRCYFFGIPFGDQGFCLSKVLFEKIGGFPENLLYGEDHLFIWHAKQFGIKIMCTGGKLLTSARKYKSEGWLRLTLKYQRLWCRQALPEIGKFLSKKVVLTR